MYAKSETGFGLTTTGGHLEQGECKRGDKMAGKSGEFKKGDIHV